MWPHAWCQESSFASGTVVEGGGRGTHEKDLITMSRTTKGPQRDCQDPLDVALWVRPPKVRQGVYRVGLLADEQRGRGAGTQVKGGWRWCVEGPGFQPSKEEEFCQYPWLRDLEAIRETEVSQVSQFQGGPSQGRCLPPAQGPLHIEDNGRSVWVNFLLGKNLHTLFLPLGCGPWTQEE